MFFHSLQNWLDDFSSMWTRRNILLFTYINQWMEMNHGEFIIAQETLAVLPATFCILGISTLCGPEAASSDWPLSDNYEPT